MAKALAKKAAFGENTKITMKTPKGIKLLYLRYILLLFRHS